MEDVTWIDYLSFRASLGTVGNDRLGTFPSLGLFNAGAIADYNGESGVIPNQPANPDLKWEESQKYFVESSERIDIRWLAM